MLTIKAGLNTFLRAQAGLTNIVGTRIYHEIAPQNPTYPLMVYQMIADVPFFHTHDQRVGPWRARFQIDCYAESLAAAEDLLARLSGILAAYKGLMGSFTVGVVFDEGRNPDRTFQQETTLKSIQVASNDFAVLYHRPEMS